MTGWPASSAMDLYSQVMESVIMKAVVDLFSTDYGLLSLGVLLFIIVMAVWFLRFFSKKMAESAKAQR